MADALVNRGERFVFDGNEPAPDSFVLEEPLDPSDLNKAVLQMVLEGTPLVRAERVNTGNLAALRLVGGDGLVVTMPLRINGDAIQTAIDAIPVSTGGKVVLPAGTYNLTRGLVVEKNAVSIEGHGVTLLAQASAPTALMVKAPPGQSNNLRFRMDGNIVIQRYQHAIGLVSVGLHLENVSGAVVRGVSVEGFRDGILLMGNTQGCYDNLIMPDYLRDNTRQIVLSRHYASANQNRIMGGKLQWMDQAVVKNALAAQIAIKKGSGTGTSPNGNFFQNVDIEGPATGVGKAVICEGDANTFVNIRTEIWYDGIPTSQQTANGVTWRFTGDSHRNLVLGGRNVVPNNIVNEGKGNAIYFLEDQNGSGERVISTPVIISANLPGNDNPSRGRKHVVALMPVATPTGQLAGATGMVFVNDNDPDKLLHYVAPDGVLYKVNMTEVQAPELVSVHSVNASPNLPEAFAPVAGFTWSFAVSKLSYLIVAGHVDTEYTLLAKTETKNDQHPDGQAIGVSFQLKLNGSWLAGSKTGENILNRKAHYYAAQIHGFKKLNPGNYTIELHGRSYSSQAAGVDGLAKIKGTYNQVAYRVVPVQ